LSYPRYYLLSLQGTDSVNRQQSPARFQPTRATAPGAPFIADLNNRRILKITPAGVISTVAGNGVDRFSGDAPLDYPAAVAVDGSGNLFIAEGCEGDYAPGGCRIRKVTPDGVISTVAGTGVLGFSGDGGPATSAQLANSGSEGPTGVAVDGFGNLFIADWYNGRVRKVTFQQFGGDLQFDRTSVVAGSSFSAYVSGSNLTPQTFFDVRFTSPAGNDSAVVLNWQRGLAASHGVAPGTALGRWTINGVRAHEIESDHTGSFFPVSATITVSP